MVQLSLLSKRAVKVRPTSIEARRSIRSEDITVVQSALLEILREHGPLTDEEIARALVEYRFHVSPSGARTRRAELVVLGRVRDSGKRGKTASGRTCIVWELVR